MEAHGQCGLIPFTILAQKPIALVMCHCKKRKLIADSSYDMQQSSRILKSYPQIYRRTWESMLGDQTGRGTTSSHYAVVRHVQRLSFDIVDLPQLTY